MAIRVTAAGTARPTEVLEALGLDARAHLHRLRRTRVTWSGIDPPPDTPHAAPPTSV